MRRGILSVGCAVLALTGAGGCTTVYSGTAGVSSPGEYNLVTGNYTQEFSASLDQTWDATLEAVQALELNIVGRAKDQIGGRILARRAEGTEVEITLKPRGLALTVVQVEVGWGDRDASIRIGQEVERRLKK
jgi:hypothetical protein